MGVPGNCYRYHQVLQGKQTKRETEEARRRFSFLPLFNCKPVERIFEKTLTSIEMQSAFPSSIQQNMRQITFDMGKTKAKRHCTKNDIDKEEKNSFRLFSFPLSQAVCASCSTSLVETLHVVNQELSSTSVFEFLSTRSRRIFRTLLIPNFLSFQYCVFALRNLNNYFELLSIFSRF